MTQQPAKEQTTKSKKQTPGDQSITIKTPVEVKLLNTGKTPDEAAKEAKEQEEKASSDRWMMGLTAILGGIAFLQLIAFVWQALRLGDTVRVMKDDFVATHRPRIRVRNVRIQGDLWGGERLGIATDIVNNGITAAKIKYYSARILILLEGIDLPPGPEYSKMIVVRDQPFLESGVAITLAPMDEQIVTISDDDNTGIRYGRKKLYGFGFVIYEDTTGRQRQTAFRRVLVPPQGPGSGSKTGHFIRLHPEREAYEYED